MKAFLPTAGLLFASGLALTGCVISSYPPIQTNTQTNTSSSVPAECISDGGVVDLSCTLRHSQARKSQPGIIVEETRRIIPTHPSIAGNNWQKRKAELLNEQVKATIGTQERKYPFCVTVQSGQGLAGPSRFTNVEAYAAATVNKLQLDSSGNPIVKVGDVFCMNKDGDVPMKQKR